MLPQTTSRPASPSFWDEVFNVRRDFDRLVGDRLFGQSMSVWSPPVDVQETNDGIHVNVELPGLKPEDVELTVENGILTISGEKKDAYEGKANGGVRRIYERRYGRFERSFTLPRGVDAEKVSANFENGVLRIGLPKAEAAKPRKIAIKG